jgi:hypothetical protein
VFFDVEGITNSFKIFRNEHYQWSEIANDDKVHICLDNVYYPIDFSKLNIKPISVPVGLRFSLSDGIVPTPNRESIRYTHSVTKKIEDKIKQLCTHFVTEFNNSLIETEDVMGALDFYSNDKKMKLPNGKQYSISILEQYSNVGIRIPSIKGLPLITSNFRAIHQQREYLFTDYKINYFYKKRKFIREMHYNDKIPFWHLRREDVKMVVLPRELDIMTRRYLKEQWGNDNVVIVEKYTSLPLNSGRVNSYYSILKLNNFPKSEWRALIQEFQKMKEMIVSSRFEDMSSFLVPQDWVKSYRESTKRPSVKSVKRQKRENVLEGDMKFKFADGFLGYRNDFKFKNGCENMKTAHRHPVLTVYGKEDDRKLFIKLYSIFKNVRFCIVSEKNFETLEKADIHNWKSVAKFLSKDSRHMRRIAAVNAIFEIASYESLSRNVYFITSLFAHFGQSLSKLSEYVNKTKINLNNNFREEFGMGHDMDLSIHQDYMYVKRFVEKHPCIKAVSNMHYHEGSEVQKFIVDGFKYNKCRLNHEHYVKRGEQ